MHTSSASFTVMTTNRWPSSAPCGGPVLPAWCPSPPHVVAQFSPCGGPALLAWWPSPPHVGSKVFCMFTIIFDSFVFIC